MPRAQGLASSGAGALATPVGMDVEGYRPAFDDLAIDDDLADAIETRQLEHRIEEDRLHDRAQPARSGLAQDRPMRDRLQRLLVELEVNVLHLEEPLILLDEGILGLGQDVDQRALVEIVKRRYDGEAADELRYEAELQEVLGLEIAQDLAGLALLGTAHLGAEADRGPLPAMGDDLFEAGEGAAADEENVGGIDLQEFLLRVLASALRRHARDRPLHDFQQRLLDALARNVAGDRRIVGFAADLVDLVDIDDAALRPLDIVIGRLQQLQDDVLDILANIAGFRERRRIGHGEGHVDDAGQGLRQQGLAGARRADEQDVRFGELDVVVLRAMRETLIVVVHRDGEDALGVILADHIVVEHLADIFGPRHAVARFDKGRLVLLTDDVHAELDAFVADEHGGAGDELAHLVLAFAAEGAVQRVLRVATAGLGHSHSVSNRGGPRSTNSLPRIPSRLRAAEL